MADKTGYDRRAINRTPEKLYAAAKREAASQNWKRSREHLLTIEKHYPFGVYAQQALMDLSYVNWKDNESTQALDTIDRFQRLYPQHPRKDYVLYLRGLIHFAPATNFIAKLTSQDPSERDPAGLRISYKAFIELINEFPNSKYTSDARKRVAWLINAIAMNEIHVARYYYRHGAYIAAANRAQTVIIDFEGVPAVEEALYILIQAYDGRGMDELRNDAKRVLQKNFPGSAFRDLESYDIKD